MARGKFIAIYGINNLGKTTQAKMLVERLGLHGAMYLKYPLYNLSPSGPVINAYLRGGNPHELSPREFQMLNIKNRTQYDHQLRNMLERGLHVVAEDYTGTGIAWGIGAGVRGDFLKNLNSHLLREDFAFLFDGRRFNEGLEKGHVHESNDDLTEKVRKIHLELAEEFGWHVVEANRPIEVIHEEIWSKVKPLLTP